MLIIFHRTPTNKLMSNHDPLFFIFKSHLDKADPDKAEVSDLIYDVVAEYMAHLMGTGNVPHYILDVLEADLREETLEMYRKTTYGHGTLKAYKKAKVRA